MPIVNDTPPTDSIRVYLKEIGSIKLLKGNEEIELARSIADLLHLESIRNALQERLNRLPSDREWANELNMDVPQFRRRLYLGRRAKNKMVEAIASSISRERSAAASSSQLSRLAPRSAAASSSQLSRLAPRSGSLRDRSSPVSRREADLFEIAVLPSRAAKRISSRSQFSRLGHVAYVTKPFSQHWGASIAPAEPYSQLLSVLQVKFGRTEKAFENSWSKHKSRFR